MPESTDLQTERPTARVAFAVPPDGRDADRLFAALYDELHRVAAAELRRQGGGLALGATTLLHEAFLAMHGSEARFPDDARFLGYVARAMRGLVIDHVRRARAQKRGGGAAEITLVPETLPALAPGAGGDVEQLGDALDALAVDHPALAELVDLHFFAGLTFGEIARLRGASERTVQRDWRKARLLLHRMLRGGEAGEAGDAGAGAAP